MIKLPLLLLSLVSSGFLISAVAAGELPHPSFLVGPTVVIIILIIFNALFVAAEFAIIGVRPTQIEQLANDGNRLAKTIVTILRSPDKQNRYIATAQVGITITSLGLGMYGESQISHFVEPYLARWLGVEPHDTLIVTIGYIFSVILLTYLHVVAGEMIPKSLALATPDKAVLGIARPMAVMQTILAIPVRFLNWIGMLLLSLFRIPPVEGHERLHSPEELELIVRESAQGGLLDLAEEELIRNIFDFAEREVNQVMTPRPKIQAIPHDISLADMLQQITESNYSRFPVYEGDLDHIVGVVHVKDLVRQHLRLKGNFDMRLLLRPVHVVPEHYSAEKLLTAFKHRRHHMAIVLDEFGGTAGVVTLEDLVEEVVGEVRDEFDQESDPLIQIGSGELELSGDYLLDDLADYLYLGKTEDLPDVDTVGGLIMAKLGRVPQTGDQISLENQVNLTVLEVDGLAVARVRMKYPASDSTESTKTDPDTSST
jgi:CBS domain containing-hemolysin-like protein